jgi:hypothetical protein
MKKDLLILLIFLTGIIVFLVVAFGFGKNGFSTTSWINKKSGDGPWEIPVGDRESETNLVLDADKIIDSYDPKKLDIKKTTSSHKIIFSTHKTEINEILYDKPKTSPPIKY